MKLFADECVYQKTVEALQSWGHDIITAREVGLSGRSDEQILAYSVNEGRILITTDLDFSNIRYYPPKEHWGIIVLKIRPAILTQVHAVLKKLLEQSSQEYFTKALVIVDRNKYRVRRA
jgi:predicted nuclease of predicted toxin-antitoxin system